MNEGKNEGNILPRGYNILLTISQLWNTYFSSPYPLTACVSEPIVLTSFNLHSFNDCYMYLLIFLINYRVAVCGLILSKNQRKMKKKMKRRKRRRKKSTRKKQDNPFLLSSLKMKVFFMEYELFDRESLEMLSFSSKYLKLNSDTSWSNVFCLCRVNTFFYKINQKRNG